MDRKALRKRIMKKTYENIEENLAGKEVHIIKASNLLGDLDAISNLLKENIGDWAVRSPSGEANEKFLALKANSDIIDKEKEELSKFIEKEMEAELPSFSNIAGYLLGARLLASAGSKKKLAFVPSSTMQLFGAEKALFSHIKKHTKMPKHGHIFNHPFLQKLPKEKRGKAARILAGKLSIAARIDYFGGKKNLTLRKEAEIGIGKL